MSEHHHHDGEECHCHDHHHDGECHCHDHHHDHEPTSLEQAGGCAVGLTGTLCCWNADAEARFAKCLITIGKWVESEAGMLLGHIKAAITLDDGTGITLNLTDLENGVEHHGSLEPQEKVHFTFMCAVLDVEEHELKHRMFHAIDDSGLDYDLDTHVECACGHHHDHGHHHHDGEECHCHDHHHDGECHCHDHHHDHGHHHHDGEACHCHDHHHDGECHCHDHHHDHGHHHHDGEACHCVTDKDGNQHCHTYPDVSKIEHKPKKKSFFDRLRRR